MACGLLTDQPLLRMKRHPDRVRNPLEERALPHGWGGELRLGPMFGFRGAAESVGGVSEWAAQHELSVDG